MLIELKNVSKFYHSKGLIVSGFSRVNLSLDTGEFVVITGESGSGKSTLLNVISGLDSYEEGELYIEGMETSHYMTDDFEEYRKKYIGNIFQNYNLVLSYTVYQNVELILRINGYSKTEIKEKVPAILERVGLSEYSNTKVSKLSGGQKQRVAIARALAKETKIVVADEPTGNLDSQSAEGIAELLKEISKDRLVIVVTHNYEQFAPYATRKIKMHDGKIVEDELLKKPEVTDDKDEPEIKNGSLSAGSKVRLGLRNTFNIFPKFVLLLIVFAFIVFAVTGEYTNFKNSEAEAAKLGYNDYFINYSEDRVVLKKADKSAFTEADYAVINSIEGIRGIVNEDIMLDSDMYVEDDDFSFDVYCMNVSNFHDNLVMGRMPEKGNEVILCGYKDDYLMEEDMASEMLDKTYKLFSWMYEDSFKVKVVGIAYINDDESQFRYSGKLYLTDTMISKMTRNTYRNSSKITTLADDTELVCEYGSIFYKPVVNPNVSKGEAMVYEEMNGYFKNGSANGKTIKITAENMFYDASVKVKITDIYTENNFKNKTGLKSFDSHGGEIYLNESDYNKLFINNQYQTTVYLASMKDAEETISMLEGAGYIPLALKDTLITYNDEITSVVQVPMAVILLIAVFLISYFVIQLILKSRSSYFSILRMLGMKRRNIRRIMDIELFTVMNIAYILFLILIIVVNKHIIDIEYLRTLVEYMRVSDYVILYIALTIMSYLISGKFTRKMFKKSTMGSFREEV